ncbi:hypothetical protein CCP4SC76_3260028 [Gammaproteobacteria bacterium]
MPNPPRFTHWLASWLLLAITTMFPWLPTSSASDNLLTNGSFELYAGTNPGNSYRAVAAGSTDITNWTVSGSGVDLLGGQHWIASDGQISIDLDGTSGPGALTQTIVTVPGQLYSVTFNLAGNPDGYNAGADTNPIKNLRVSAAGQQTDYSFDVTGKTASSMGWQTKTWQFTASAAQTELKFASLSTDSGSYFGPVIDNLQVASFATGAINDTGQVTCYNGSSLAACTEANTGDTSTYPRQDGRYGRDAQADAGNLTKTGGGVGGFDFTALDANGLGPALSRPGPVFPWSCRNIRAERESPGPWCVPGGVPENRSSAAAGLFGGDPSQAEDYWDRDTARRDNGETA